MEKRLLLTRSRHDIANQYLYAYSEEILSEAQLHGWKVSNADDEDNTRVEVESRIGKTGPIFVFFNGHGSRDNICGNKNEAIMDADSVQLLSQKIVFARSCNALAGLGRRAVDAGCRAFVGYRGVFILPHTYEYEATPLRDPLAKPVMQVSNLVGKRILKGSTLQNSVSASQSMAGGIMLKMLASSEPANGAILRALYQNFSNLDFEGDGLATAEK